MSAAVQLLGCFLGCSARNRWSSRGGEGRIRTPRFPARKSLEEFDFDHARCRKRDTIATP